MLRKSIPAKFLILSALLGSVVTIGLFFLYQKYSVPVNEVPAIVAAEKPDCKYNLDRLQGYKYTHPIFSVEPECESEKYSVLKSEVTSVVESEKNCGNTSSASVYFMNLSDDTWMSVNGREQYHPGSLLKIVQLITYLKMSETDPGLFQKKIEFRKEGAFGMTQTFNSKTIEPGHSYTVRELLRFMIANSDNYATTLLSNHMDTTLFLNAFSDIGLSRPNLKDLGYTINPLNYSKFFRVLYDAGYLSISSSEYAISLLTQCDFKDGIVQPIPASVKVAHKFGETGFGDTHELHESAIVFLNNSPYLITIMTKGPDVNKQKISIANISRAVYEYMSAPPKAAQKTGPIVENALQSRQQAASNPAL